ncbi:hypothetical protein BV898_15666 [Hypsibius exemplaris]|uniref:HTH psq-type domain-containing protein n=1 Tax=Hypsibius exemplaris TaxID=2072580 RepID=A0A9X6NEG3_HYPEX|nr:hypothetical protein BV898_15666 [Hypsibius exemplaris]
MSDVIKKGISVRLTANIYDIPRSTLSFHLSNQSSSKIWIGAPCFFSPFEEEASEEMIIFCSQFQIEMARTEFLRVVIEGAKSKGLIPENVEVGDKWFRKFLQRHPEVSERGTQAQNIKKLKEWAAYGAEQYIALLSSLHEEGYLDNPDGVFNYDESAFKLAILYSKTLAETGTKYMYSFAASTVLGWLNLIE